MTPAAPWAVCRDPALGLDVSHWQGLDVPWRAVRELGIRWAVAKLWHGRGLVQAGAVQLARARSVALELLGAYAWFLPDAELGAQVAAWTSIDRARGDLPLTIDFEEPATALRGAALVERLEEVIARVSDRIGRRPILYTGEWYWHGYCGDLDSPLAAECPLWLAAYPRKESSGLRYREALAEVCGGAMPAIPHPWRVRGLEPVAWQFDGDHGLVLPNGADVDVNSAAWARFSALALPDTEPAPVAIDLHEAPTWPGKSAPLSIFEAPVTPLRAGEGEHDVKPEGDDSK